MDYDGLTLLLHLGYLAYSIKTSEVFIPNEEVRSTFVRAVRNEGWKDVYDAIQNSEKLLAATLEMDEMAVARMSLPIWYSFRSAGRKNLPEKALSYLMKSFLRL